MESTFAPLRNLLKKRLDIIGDRAWRDRDAEGHLAALRDVSEALVAEHAKLRGKVPPRLNHFLTQASYEKALEFIGASEEC